LTRTRQTRLDIKENKLIATTVTKGRRFSVRNDDDGYSFSVNPYRLDIAKILQGKSIRRLADKTQVHSLPSNPHIRTRLIHTFEVVANSTLVADELGLNVNLCEAIAWGHDVGHTPYGHTGEEVLGINHAVNGAVILQEVERKGAGLNLTREVIDGIISHSRNKKDLFIDKRKSNEISLIVYIDKISYTFSDFNDFQRLGMFRDKEIPEAIFRLGNGINAQRKRTEACIEALVSESIEKGIISFSESEIAREFKETRDWMFKEMYHPLDWENEKENLKTVIEYFEGDGLEFCDNLHPNFVVSLMTDKEANWLSEILRNRNPTMEEINRLSLMEIIPPLNGKTIDHTKYDLW
jgi:dGTPase